MTAAQSSTASQGWDRGQARRAATLLAPGVALALVVSGCGSEPQPSNPTPATVSATATSNATSAAQCPQEPTQKFAKTRFATNIGLAVGTFSHWVYKPYRAGSFEPGAKGRTLVLVKAGAAGLFAAKQLKDARDNVLADPTLCRAFVGPLSAAEAELTQLGEALRKGDISGITGAQQQLDKLTGQAEGQGFVIEPRNGL